MVAHPVVAPFAVINSAWARQDTAELDALSIAFLRTELFPVRAHLSLLRERLAATSGHARLGCRSSQLLGLDD